MLVGRDLARVSWGHAGERLRQGHFRPVGRGRGATFPLLERRGFVDSRVILAGRVHGNTGRRRGWVVTVLARQRCSGVPQGGGRVSGRTNYRERVITSRPGGVRTGRGGLRGKCVTTLRVAGSPQLRCNLPGGGDWFDFG